MTDKQTTRIIISAVDDTRTALNSVDSGLRGLSDRAESVSKSFGSVAWSVASLVAVGGISTKIIDVQRQFDVLNASLVTMTGSAAQARIAFSALQQFAATTPFSMQEVTAAFVKLKSLGLDPSQRAMESYGNTASAMGKSLNQLIEAVADASTGEFERLKEFGIKASQSGDQVALTFQGVTTTIGKSAAEITDYLTQIGEHQFAGAMAERAKTLDGAISNLADSWDNLFLTVSSGGAGSLIYDSVTLASGAVGDMTAIIKAMTAASDENKASTGDMATIQSGIATVFETVAVVGANVAYVFKAVRTELGGLAAKANAVARLDFSGAKLIGEEMKADSEAARKEIDALSERILNARNQAVSTTESLDDLAKSSSKVGATDSGLLDKYLSDLTNAPNTVKLAAAIEKENAAFREAVKGLEETDARYIKALESHQQRLAELNKRSSGGAQGRVSDYAKLTASIQQAISAQEIEIATGEKASASEKLRAQITEQLASGQIKLTAAQQAGVAAMLNQLAAGEQNLTRIKAESELRDQIAKAEASRVTSVIQTTEQIRKDTASIIAHTAEMGVSRSEIVALTAQRDLDTLALKEHELAQLESTGQCTAYTAALREEIAALKDRAAALQDQSFREVEQESKEAAKKAAEQWERTADKIGDSITDSLMRGFESGKSFAENLRDTVENMFKTMVLQPVIKAGVVGGLSAVGILGSPSAMAEGSATASGGIGSYLNLGSSIGSAYNMISGGQGLVGGLYSNFAMSGLGASLGLSTGLSSALGVAGGAGTVMGGGAALAAAEATSAGAAGLTSLGSTIGTAIPIIGGVLAVGSILSDLFGGSGERFERTATSQTATYNNGKYENTGEADYYKDGPDFGSSIDKALVLLNKQFSTSVGTLLESLGEEANITTDARVRLRRTSGKLATDFYATINGVDIVQQQQYGKDGEDIGGSVTQFVTDVLSKGIVKAVEASSLDAAIKSLFSDLDGVEQVSGMVSSVSALGKYSSELNDVWGLSVAQAAKVASATSDTTDALISTVAAMATFAASQRSVGEQLFTTYEDLVDSFAEISSAKFPDTLAAYDAAMKGVNKTTEEGLKTFTDLFALREQYAAFRAAVVALQSGVAESTFALRDAQEQAAIQQQKLVDSANAAGIAVPRSAEELLALADKIDYTTESGLNLAAAMPALASAFAAAQTAAQATITGLQSTASDAYNIALKYAQDAVGVAEDALDAARNAAERAIEAAYESASSALEAQIDNLESISDTIKSALESNGVENSLAGYRLAQQGLELALAQMKAGQAVDADSLAQMVSRAVNPDAGWFATQSDMLRAQAKTNATLTALGSVTDTRKTAAETALESLTQQYDKQINALNGIDDTVKTVEQALADYAAAQKALNLARFNLQQVELGKAQLDALNGVNNGIGSLAEAMRALNDSIYALALATAQAVTKPVGNYTGTNGAGYSAANDTWNSSAGAATTQTLKDMLTYSVNTQGVSKTYQGATGAGLSVQDIDRIGGLTAGTTASAAASDIKADLMAASAGGAEAIYRKAKQLGLTLSQVDALAGWSASTAAEWAKANGLPTFAAGGYHAGGLRLVGENGPELEVTGPSRILNADLTRRMLDGGSNEALVAEVRALREEVASLRAANEATARNTYSTKQSLDRVVDGDALLTRVAA